MDYGWIDLSGWRLSNLCDAHPGTWIGGLNLWHYLTAGGF